MGVYLKIGIKRLQAMRRGAVCYSNMPSGTGVGLSLHARGGLHFKGRQSTRELWRFFLFVFFFKKSKKKAKAVHNVQSPACWILAVIVVIAVKGMVTLLLLFFFRWLDHVGIKRRSSADIRIV